MMYAVICGHDAQIRLSGGIWQNVWSGTCGRPLAVQVRLDRLGERSRSGFAHFHMIITSDPIAV